MMQWNSNYPPCPDLTKDITTEKEAQQFLKQLDRHLFNNNGLVNYERIIEFIFSQSLLSYKAIPYYFQFTEKTELPKIQFVRNIVQYAPFDELPGRLLELIISNTLQLIRNHERQDTLDDQDHILNELIKIITQGIVNDVTLFEKYTSDICNIIRMLFTTQPLQYSDLRQTVHRLLSFLPNKDELLISLISEFMKENKEVMMSCLNLKEEQKQIEFSGMENCGATCYINSVVQQLHNIESFKQNILQTALNGSHSIMKMIFERMKEKKEYIIMSDIVKYILGPSNIIDVSIQDDSYLFLTMMLDILNEERKSVNQERYSDFTIETITHLLCMECGNERKIVEYNSSIRVDSIHNDTLEEALDKLKGEETLDDVECPICQRKTQHYRNIQFGNCKNLIIGINRNHTLENGIHFKLNKSFVFPLQFTWENQPMELSGFVLHSGTTQAGHYTSVIKDSNGKWWKCNDKKVIEYNTKRIKEDGYGTSHHSLSASILFYKPIEYIDTNACEIETTMDEEPSIDITNMRVIYHDKQLYNWFENYYTKHEMNIPGCNELLYCFLSSSTYSTFSKVGSLVQPIKFTVDVQVEELPIMIKDAITNKTSTGAATKWIEMQEKTSERREQLLHQFMTLTQQYSTPQQYASIARLFNTIESHFPMISMEMDHHEVCTEIKEEKKETITIYDQAVVLLEYLSSLQRINEQVYALLLALTSIFHSQLMHCHPELLSRIIIIPEEKFALRDLKMNKEKYQELILKSMNVVNNVTLMDYLIRRVLYETNKQTRSQWRILLQTIQKEIHDEHIRNEVVEVYKIHMKEKQSNKNVLNESFVEFIKK